MSISMERLHTLMLATIQEEIRKALAPFTNSAGQIDFSKGQGFTGTLPNLRGGNQNQSGQAVPKDGSVTDVKVAVGADIDPAKLNQALLTELTQDTVAALLVASTGITLSYDDAAGTLTITGSGGGTGIAAVVAPLDPTRADGDLIYRHAHSTMTVPVGFIGDSITAGELTTTPAPTLVAGDLTSAGLTVTQYNQGHGGAQVSDWVPGASSGYLATAKAAFAAAGVRLVQIMLGTNDAGHSVSAATYQANMVLLLADLVSSGYLPVLSYSPGTNQSAVNTLLVAYQPMLDALINGVTVLRGDTQAYQYFLTNNSQTVDGVHPNDTGTPVLAQYWADMLAAPIHALASQLALDRIPIGAPDTYLRVNAAGTGYQFGLPNGASETFGVAFTGSGDVALKGDGSIATKRY